MAASGIEFNSQALRRASKALAEPWVRLRRWGPVSALMPQPAVLVLQPEGGAYLWEHGRKGSADAGMLRSARFVAVELPEASVLRRRLRYPQLPEADLRAAIELEARSSSPFDPADLVWGFATAPAAGGQADVELVSSSRRVVAAVLDAQSGRIPAGAEPEIWVPSVHGGAAMLEGFGEGRRRIQAGRGHLVALALLLSAVALAGAMAVTPSIQLKLRGMQAVRDYLPVEQKAAPLLKQRAQLVALDEDTQTVREQMGEHIDPLMLVDLLTQLVPDDTFVQKLQARGTKVTVQGYTPDTTALMNVLSRHPDVRDVKSPQGVVRAIGSAKESFTIEFQLQPHAIHPFVAPPAVAAAAAAASAPASAAAAAPSAPVARPPASSAPAPNQVGFPPNPIPKASP